MSHLLLRKKFEDPATGKTWVFMCECGRLFGSLNESVIDECAGDLLDTHREHARVSLPSVCDEFGIGVLDPCRGSAMANRSYEVNKRLAELKMLAELPPLPVLPSKP